MKNISYILLALAVVLGLTQCKKDKDNVPTELQGEKYSIALNLGGETNAKADIYPFDGSDIAPVYYTVGDKIQVAYKGVRVGDLTCTSSTIPSDPANYNEAFSKFVGDITIDPNEVDETSPLYFYFIGNQPYGSTSGKLIVDISDQTDELPVISYAASLEAFAENRESYSVQYNWLMNQCALVKFEAENIYDLSANTNDNNPYAIYKTTKEVTLYGMDNHVEIDLSDNTFTWSQVNNGAMKPYRHSSDTDGSARYAIIHHGNYTSLTAGELEVPFDPATDPYGFYGTYKIGANVAQNAYFDGAKLDLVWHSGAFSISASQQAVFSRGNLQYKDQNSTWRFAKHQYDWVGGELEQQAGVFQGNVVYDETDDVNITLKSDNVKIGDATYDGWIDLFGYGVTAHNPTFHQKGNDNYIIKTSGLWTGTGSNAPVVRFDEWGENQIVNSGKPNNTNWWTTLTKDECKYVFEDRANAGEKVGFAEITLNDGFGNEKVRGLVVLPDMWDDAWHPTTWKKADWEVISILHPYDLDWPVNDYNNVYTKAQWTDMELHGAVFLPCAGYRDQDGLDDAVEFDDGHNGQQNRGTYWAQGVQGPDAAWGFAFGYASGNDWIINGNHVQGNCGMSPDNGRSVRLVHKLSSNKFFGNKKD